MAGPAVSSSAVGAVVGAVVGDADSDSDSDSDRDGDALGASEAGPGVAVAVAEVEADDVLRECDVSSLPPANAVPVIAATSAPEVSRTSDARFMANLL
ncbi:hypothetical protein J8N05_43020 [Streptomyces sp. BH-SS-21]|uniref:Uncharacterized protein n=1 Tax=Streptomyces liliiviolaceus TaxID=2823109 RepID=A0A941BE77_9ACTN|nr:hypothetical protein [Streptomyces liliiviolaceus]MBQ0854938.1 hypothetical protein [Streptomyces liliiviolaceus]